jgi:hypothetical protein
MLKFICHQRNQMKTEIRYLFTFNNMVNIRKSDTAADEGI